MEDGGTLKFEKQIVRVWIEMNVVFAESSVQIRIMDVLYLAYSLRRPLQKLWRRSV